MSMHCIYTGRRDISSARSASRRATVSPRETLVQNNVDNEVVVAQNMAGPALVQSSLRSRTSWVSAAAVALSDCDQTRGHQCTLQQAWHVGRHGHWAAQVSRALPRAAQVSCYMPYMVLLQQQQQRGTGGTVKLAWIASQRGHVT